MTVENVFEIPNHIVAREVGGETVILDLNRGTYCGLNAVGARYWNLLATGVSMKNAVTTMLNEYEVGQSELENDILALTGELVSKNLVIERAPTTLAHG